PRRTWCGCAIISRLRSNIFMVVVGGIRSDMALVLSGRMTNALSVPAISVPFMDWVMDRAFHGPVIPYGSRQHDMPFTETPVSLGKRCPVEFAVPLSICRYSLSLFRRVLMLISRSLAAC